jgi:hypothetical protein
VLSAFLRILNSDNNNILLHIKLFETCVIPILLYCSEVWSLNIIKDNKILESKYWNMAPVKIQIKFDKFLVNVDKNSSIFLANPFGNSKLAL